MRTKILTAIVAFFTIYSVNAQLGIASFTRPSCTSCADGSATAMASGNAGPFTYQWSNGATTQSINNLTVGNYSVEIRNRFWTAGTNDCPSWTFDVSLGPCASNENITIGNANIYHCDSPTSGDGSIELNVTNNGTGTLSYSWEKNGAVYPGATNYLSALNPGIYSVAITNGCTTVHGSYEVKSCLQNEGPNPYFGPSAAQPIDCDEYGLPIGTGGQLSINGGSVFGPFTYEWSGPNGFSADTKNVGLVGQGEYCVTVTDKCGLTKSKCRTMECCNSSQVAYAYAQFPCFGYTSGFFGTWNDHDGIIRVGIPKYFDPNGYPSNYVRYPCNDNIEVEWPDGMLSTWSIQNGWTGKDEYIVAPADAGDSPFEVTITNECGCSRTSYVNFSSHSHTTSFNLNQVNLYAVLSDFMTEPSNINPYWAQLNPDIITSCSNCEKHCSAQIFCNDGGDYETLRYVNNDNPEEPCRGGTIHCDENGAEYSIPNGISGQEFIDFDATPVSAGPGLCKYPVGCLFDPGIIPSMSNFPMPVWVESPNGHVVECTSPPGDPECPNGGLLVTVGYNQDCEEQCMCVGENVVVMTCGTFNEDPDMWEFCECDWSDSHCEVYKRCLVANNPEPPFESGGCSYWSYPFQIATFDCDDETYNNCNVAARPSGEERAIQVIPKGNKNSPVTIKRILKKIVVTPNPINEKFTIYFPFIENENNIEIKIYDNNQKQVFGTTREAMTKMDYIVIYGDNIGMQAGVYYVQAVVGNEILTEKLIKI